MRSKYVVYCEHRNGNVGFSQAFKFKIMAYIFAREQRQLGYKTRVAKESYNYED